MLAKRQISFVLAASDHGTMIVSRNDRFVGEQGAGFGVGFQILETASYDGPEVEFVLKLLALLRQSRGNGLVAVDCGANIGVHTVEWAKFMTDWGSVVGIEAQQRIFYALAGNICLNNCLNATALHAAVAAAPGRLRIPVPDYSRPGSFGSLELRKSDRNEFIGQEIDYSDDRLVTVPAVSIDSLGLGRVDLLKIDVEGMEAEVLAGAGAAIERFRPVILAEHIKAGAAELRGILESHGYKVLGVGMNLLCLHESDPLNQHMVVKS